MPSAAIVTVPPWAVVIAPAVTLSVPPLGSLSPVRALPERNTTGPVPAAVPTWNLVFPMAPENETAPAIGAMA